MLVHTRLADMLLSYENYLVSSLNDNQSSFSVSLADFGKLAHPAGFEPTAQDSESQEIWPWLVVSSVRDELSISRGRAWARVDAVGRPVERHGDCQPRARVNLASNGVDVAWLKGKWLARDIIDFWSLRLQVLGHQCVRPDLLVASGVFAKTEMKSPGLDCGICLMLSYA